MLFEEFTAAIKEEHYPLYAWQKTDGVSRLYRQYEIIERMYMESVSMSKEDAYKVWKNTFGKEHKQLEQEHNATFERLTADELTVNDNNYLCAMALQVRDRYQSRYADGAFEFTVEVTCVFPNGNRRENVFIKNLLTGEKRPTARDNFSGHGFYPIEVA
jgi:hypothetical protein